MVMTGVLSEKIVASLRLGISMTRQIVHGGDGCFVLQMMAITFLIKKAVKGTWEITDETKIILVVRIV